MGTAGARIARGKAPATGNRAISTVGKGGKTGLAMSQLTQRTGKRDRVRQRRHPPAALTPSPKSGQAWCVQIMGTRKPASLQVLTGGPPVSSGRLLPSSAVTLGRCAGHGLKGSAEPSCVSVQLAMTELRRSVLHGGLMPPHAAIPALMVNPSILTTPDLQRVRQAAAPTSRTGMRAAARGIRVRVLGTQKRSAGTPANWATPSIHRAQGCLPCLHDQDTRFIMIPAEAPFARPSRNGCGASDGRVPAIVSGVLLPAVAFPPVR
ncbi:hypothetical protein ACCO45_003898 [Purpureocillium lilacinum]|uniref:Uncharacterized protein n=2 Tax=Purpureocillium lilacinum TaxID=33203 RepID=A0ABR0BVN5_PURLI|nr:hypothetical protein Purlil1_7785 [Purpureocillium lilacinum]